MIPNVSILASRAARSRHLRRGQSLAEYAMVLSFLSLLTVVITSTFALHLHGIYQPVLNAIEAARLAM
jgi:hypothetical protein